jgi:hypothetical protein
MAGFCPDSVPDAFVFLVWQGVCSRMDAGRSRVFASFPATEKDGRQRFPFDSFSLIISLFLLLLIFTYFTPDASFDVSKGSIDASAAASGGQAAQPSETGSEDKTSYYLFEGYLFVVYPTSDSDYDYDNEIYTKIFTLTCSMFAQIYTLEDPEDCEGRKVKEVRIKNFKLTDGPKLGAFGGIELDPGLNAGFNVTVEDGEVIFDTSEYSAQYSG